MRGRAGIGVLGVLCLLAAGCGSAPAGAPPQAVNVPYAASLTYVMDRQVGPAFQRATHISYLGRAGESLALVHLIAADAIPADAFLSVGARPIRDLGSKAPWAIGFASAPLVLAYNPNSPFADELRAIQDGRAPIQRLFQVMAAPGFRLGRTNPDTDPQGQAFYMMVELAARLYGLPADTVQKVVGPLDNPRQIFSETGILTELQDGNLDAASAFLPEAREHHLPYVALPPALNFADPADGALYRTVSVRLPDGRVIHGAPLTIDVTVVDGSRAGLRFVRYLLTHPAAWRRDGYRWIPPVPSGQTARIPHALHGLG